MLEVLRAVQVAQLRGEPARRISFRDIDVEQIGYIYEGLLGYSCAGRRRTVTVGLIGKHGRGTRDPARHASKHSPTHSRPTPRSPTRSSPGSRTTSPPPPRRPRPRSPRPSATASTEDADRALRAVHRPTPRCVTGSARSSGIIRRDLRDRPTVMLARRRPGRRDPVPRATPARTTRPSPRRGGRPVRPRAAGLRPGPAPAAGRAGCRWTRDRILELKVADIACGSGAFLVAAARYLADRLVEAWQREESRAGMTPHELETHAIRDVIATLPVRRGHQRDGRRDVQAVAVAGVPRPELPFSFVDDKILHGNSLLGLTDVRQLKRQHIDPDASQRPADLFERGRRRRAPAGHRLRRELATEVDDIDPQRSVDHATPPVAPLPGASPPNSPRPPTA